MFIIQYHDGSIKEAVSDLHHYAEHQDLSIQEDYNDRGRLVRGYHVLYYVEVKRELDGYKKFKSAFVAI